MKTERIQIQYPLLFVLFILGLFGIPRLHKLVASLVHQLSHPISDAFTVLQGCSMNLPVIQTAFTNMSEKLRSSREQHVVGHNHGSFTQQTRTLQHL